MLPAEQRIGRQLGRGRPSTAAGSTAAAAAALRAAVIAERQTKAETTDENHKRIADYVSFLHPRSVEWFVDG